MTFQQILFFGICMATIMSAFMSFVMVVINVGFKNPHFLKAWLRSWRIGFIVALPLAFTIPALIHKLMAMLNI